MSDIANIPFGEVTAALLDEDNILNPRYLYRLSDLEGAELEALSSIWPRISLRRRKALMEDLEALTDSDYLLSFEAVSRMAAADEEPQVRIPAFQILLEFDPVDLIPRFLELCVDDPDRGVRECTVAGLGKFVYLGELDEIPDHLKDQIEDRLIQIVGGDDEPVVRRRALEALGYSSREEINDLIREAAHLNDLDWRASVLFAMGRSANRDWKAFVLDHLDHVKPKVRQEAARAAGELELREAKAALIELTGDIDDHVRAAAAWSLSEIGGRGVRERLETMLSESIDETEASFLETVLDNLSFTEDYAAFDLLEFDEDDLAGMLGEPHEDPEQAG